MNIYLYMAARHLMLVTKRPVRQVLFGIGVRHTCSAYLFGIPVRHTLFGIPLVAPVRHTCSAYPFEGILGSSRAGWIFSLSRIFTGGEPCKSRHHCAGGLTKCGLNGGRQCRAYSAYLCAPSSAWCSAYPFGIPVRHTCSAYVL